MTPPNILIFMTDQQRAGTVLPGHRLKAITPNIDRFRAAAVTFTEAYCPSPHCCPSRATFHSGLYPTEHDVWNNVNVPNALSRGLRQGVRLWSEDFAAAGYRLDFSGKWHVSHFEGPGDRGWNNRHAKTTPAHGITGDPKPALIAQGWERYRELASTVTASEGERAPGEIRRPGYPPYRHYGIKEDGDSAGDRTMVEHALNVFGERAGEDRPWVQFIGPNGPHDAYFPPQRFLDLYRDVAIELPPTFDDTMKDKPAFYRRTRQFFDQLTPAEHREALRHYLAYCSFEDALFGEVLERLEASGQADNTIVLYLSDHGDYAGDHGLWCKGLPCFRGAYHIPLIIRWPQGQREPGRTCDAWVSLADIAPTLLAMAGIEVERSFSGSSLVPWLREETPATWRDALFTQSNGNEQYGIQRSVRTKDWLYVYNGYDMDELYDMQRDPEQIHNLADDPDHEAIRARLMQRIWRFGAEHQEEATNPYIMVGFAPVGPAAAFVSEL